MTRGLCKVILQYEDGHEFHQVFDGESLWETILDIRISDYKQWLKKEDAKAGDTKRVHQSWLGETKWPDVLKTLYEELEPIESNYYGEGGYSYD